MDDITGEPLPAESVHAGRKEELCGFEHRAVYDLVERRWAGQEGLPILGTMWVDKKRVVECDPAFASRTFKKGKAGPDDLFAPTPHWLRPDTLPVEQRPLELPTV